MQWCSTVVQLSMLGEYVKNRESASGDTSACECFQVPCYYSYLLMGMHVLPSPENEKMSDADTQQGIGRVIFAGRVAALIFFGIPGLYWHVTSRTLLPFKSYWASERQVRLLGIS